MKEHMGKVGGSSSPSLPGTAPCHFPLSKTHVVLSPEHGLQSQKIINSYLCSYPFWLCVLQLMTFSQFSYLYIETYNI